MPRTITSHQVDGLNPELVIEALDDPKPGESSHDYRIVCGEKTVGEIHFHSGPLNSQADGVTMECLLAIVADRLAAFQTGELKCKENMMALVNTQQAIMALHRRTRDRQERKVLGEKLK